MITYGKKFLDSTGVFLIGQLEQLDRTVHEPLFSATWSRDIDLRTDVAMGHEFSSFTNQSFASTGGISTSGISWSGKISNTAPSITTDTGKISVPLHLWAQEVGWTLPELSSAQLMGIPLDTTKYQGMQIKYQMDADQVTYLGDSTIGMYGMLNSPRISASNVANGAAGTPQFSTKTADEILSDINNFLTLCWQNSGWSVVPEILLLPPMVISDLSIRKVSTIGTMSILNYIKENVFIKNFGKELSILPVKWLQGTGASNTDRMVAYTKDYKYLRLPLVPLQRTAPQPIGLEVKTTYYGKFGAVEWVYPETALYGDGI